MKTRSLLDNLPLEIIIKIASYVNDDDRLSLLRSSDNAIKKFPSLKNDYRHPNSHLRDNLGLHIKNFQHHNESHFNRFCWGILMGIIIMIKSCEAFSLSGLIFGCGLTFFSHVMNNKTHNASNVEAINLHEAHLQILGIKK